MSAREKMKSSSSSSDWFESLLPWAAPCCCKPFISRSTVLRSDVKCCAMLGGVDRIAKEKKRERKILYTQQVSTKLLSLSTSLSPFWRVTAARIYAAMYAASFPCFTLPRSKSLSLPCICVSFYGFSGDAAFPFSLLCLLNGEKDFLFRGKHTSLKKIGA